MSKKKIKVVEVKRMDYILKSFKDEDISLHEYPALFRKFDANGRLLEEISYSSDGSFSEKYNYVYQDEILKEQLIFMDENTVGEHRFFEYTDGKLSKIITKYAEDYTDETIFSYDLKGKLISKITFDDGDEGEKHLYEYDTNSSNYRVFDEYGKIELLETRTFSAEGNLLKLISSDYKDDIETTTEFKYNDKNLLIEETSKNKKNIISSFTTYSYDERGNLATSILNKGKDLITTSYKFDEKNNETEQIETDKNGLLNHSIIRTYDEDGNLLSSKTEIFMHGQGIDLKYDLEYEYIFFD